MATMSPFSVNICLAKSNDSDRKEILQNVKEFVANSCSLCYAPKPYLLLILYQQHNLCSLMLCLHLEVIFWLESVTYATPMMSLVIAENDFSC